MDTLARVVHDAVTHHAVVDLAGLSPEEQQTMKETQNLLRLSPKELLTFLADQQAPEDWLAPLPSVALPARS